MVYSLRMTAAIFLLSLTIMSCQKLDLKKAVPACVEKSIRTIKNEEVRNPPAEVWEWRADGKVYYYISSDCCDQFNYLYDDTCNVVCAPDGGFTGTGDGNCPGFEGVVEKELIWQDDRK